MHAVARLACHGITVSFCDGDATDDVMRVIETIGLAKSMDIELPTKRIIVLADVDVMRFAMVKLSDLVLNDESICCHAFFRDQILMDQIDVARINRLVRRIGFDECVFHLADLFYQKKRGLPT